MIRPAILALALCAAAPAAMAKPPAHFDPQYGSWFRSLLQPGTGISCCNEADCRFVEYHESSDPKFPYEAKVLPAYPGGVAEYDKDGKVVNGKSDDSFHFPTAQAEVWVKIPAETVLRDMRNPTGFAVMCWTPALGPLCFVIAPQV